MTNPTPAPTTSTIARTLGLYGVTDSGKTAQASRFARYIYEKHNKITRYIGADGGDWQSIMRPLIDLGVVETYSLMPLAARKQSVFSAIHQFSRGKWPINAGKTDISGNPVATFQDSTAETWKRVGAYIIDSGTGLAELLEDEMKSSSGMRSGKEQTFNFSVEGESVSGGSWDHVRAAQDTIKRLTVFFGALPVERVLWTFGEYLGTEEVTRKSIYGPAIVGKAMTGKLPKDLGLLIHCEIYAQASKQTDNLIEKPHTAPSLRRMYFMSHAEPSTGVMYPAKPRIPPSAVPALLARWKNGFLEPHVIPETGEMVDGLDDFLKFEDGLLARSSKADAEWKGRLDAARSAPVTGGGPK